MFRTPIERFLHQTQGNVAMTFALSLVPLVFLSGMALDYASSTSRLQRLNAAADSAALAAVSPSLMSQTTTQAKTVATNVFSAQRRRSRA
jgi:Flp pilus assembly protein TadG